MSWRDRAECRGVDPDVFYPTAPQEGQAPDWGPARAICARCPVIDDCRANHSKERFGFWFGTTPRERGWGSSGEPLRLIGRQQPVRDAVLKVLAEAERPLIGSEIARRCGGSGTAVRVALRWHAEQGHVVADRQPHPKPDLWRITANEQGAA